MPTNNQIALSVQPLQLVDPLDQYAKATRVGNMIQQSREHAQRMEHTGLQIDKQRRDAADEENWRASYTEGSGDPIRTIEAARKRGVPPKIIQDYQKQLGEDVKQKAELKKLDFDNTASLTQEIFEAHEAVARGAPEQRPQLYDRVTQDLLKRGRIKPEDAKPYDPATFDIDRAVATTQANAIKQAAELRAQAEEKHKESMRPAQEEKAASDALAAASEASQKAKTDAGTSSTGIRAVDQAHLDMEQKRFNKEVDALHETIRSHRATEAETQRFHNLSLEGVQLTPEARAKMAEMFATTGVLPSLGNGKEASRNRSDIINEAAERYPNVQFATQKASFQANETALKNLQKQSDAVEAFENTASKNIDVLLTRAKGIIDTGSPLLNSPVRMVSEKLFGSENMAAFRAARETALTEAAKVLESPQGSASLTVSGRAAIKTLSDENATLGMQVASMKVLKQDMQNRKQSNREQIEAIKKRITAPESGDKPASAEKVKVWNPKTNKFE